MEQLTDWRMVLRRADWPRRVVLSIGVVISAFGMVVFIAWYEHFVRLIQPSPGLPPTTREGALALMLGGASLSLQAAGRARSARLCSLALLVLAALVLSEYALNRSLGIDQLLGAGYIVESGAPPGRLSPLAASCYVGISVALLALSSRRLAGRASTIAGIIASVLVAMGLVILLTFFLRHTLTYSWGHFRRISLQTAAATMLLGVGVLVLALRESRLRGAPPRWLPAGIALGLFVAAFGVWQVLAVHEASDLPLISNVILGGGILGAALVGVSVHFAQKATLRSREMLEGKAAFERLFEASPDALLVVDRSGRVVRANERAAAAFAYPREELLGQNIENLLPEESRDVYPLPSQEHAAHPAPRQIRAGSDIYARRKDGSEFSVEVALSLLNTGPALETLAAVRDITERKRSQEALRRSEEQFRGVFEQGPLGITLMRRDFRFAKINAALCRMLGYSEAELMGMTPLDFSHPDDRDPTVNMVDRLFSTEAPVHRMEKRYVKKNGDVIWGSLTASVIHDQQGWPLYGMGMIEDITERKRTEETLRTLTERLSLATRIASMGVWDWDLRTNLEVWDESAFNMFGLPHVNPLRHEEFVARIHPEDRERVAAASKKVIREKTQVSMEFRILRTDGAVRNLSVAAGAVLDGLANVVRMVGIAVDITERKRAEEELRILNQRLSLATRSSSMGVWEFDPRTEIAIWDDRMFQIFGIPPTAQVARKDWERCIRPEDLPKVQAFIASVINDRAQDAVEIQIIRPDGSPRHVSVTGGPVLSSRNSVTALVGIALDITERKQMQMAIEVSARLSALGMMAGGVAHEINNPLSVIHAMASDLVETVAAEGAAAPEVVARKGAIIRETADRIARIVKSLRQISREGSRDTLRPAPLAKIVTETLEICQAKFVANQVDLLLPDALPDLSIPCREVQIEQALLNLLQNAFDAVVDQPGRRWVRLRVQPGNGFVAISILDSGPGIRPDLRPRLMEPFFTTKPVGKGTGLGLSLSKTIAEDHGGRLEYSDDHGHTCFSLVLPVARKAEAA